MSTSQFGEKEQLDKIFQAHPPKHKVLVDVGACGKELSNSWDLLASGWTGLLVEADPSRVPIIEQDFATFKYSLCNYGVSDKEELLDFHVHSVMGHSSFLADWYPQTDTGTTRKIKCRPLVEILLEHLIPGDFDLLSIDIEGMDEKVLTAMFETSLYRPRIVIAECTSFKNPDELFGKYGYALHAKLGNEGWGNLIYIKKQEGP